MIKFYRVGWLDSCRMPSRVHCTVNEIYTLCDHFILNPDWIIKRVTTRTKGESRYCRICFKDQPKNLEWMK